MNPIQLAGLIKRVYPNFDMNSFGNRLKLQKLVYLMKASNLDLGYKFRLYLNGPYSTMLARDGFDMFSIQKSKEIKFEENNIEQRFVNLIDFLKDYKNDRESMEIFASLHLFHHLFPEKNEQELIRDVEQKSPMFKGKGKEIKKLLNKLKEFKEIKW